MNSAIVNVLLLVTFCDFVCMYGIHMSWWMQHSSITQNLPSYIYCTLYSKTKYTYRYRLFQVILEDSFSGHQGNDLYDPDKANYRIFRVKKSATLQDFLEQVAESLVSSHVTYPLYGNSDVEKLYMMTVS